jgi:peptide deformylase
MLQGADSIFRGFIGKNVETLAIVTWPAKVLETTAEEVTVFDAELATLCQQMHATMDKGGNTVGLAANQVNVLKRVVTGDVVPSGYF